VPAAALTAAGHGSSSHLEQVTVPLRAGGLMAQKKKILLVDDSSTVLLMERMMLSDGRFDLVLAHDGQEAVEKAVAEHPDVIFMDVIMPQMNGFEACRALRARPETKAIPVIMVTTRGEPNNVEMGYASGCNEYITKPFDSVELLAKLRNYLGE
jgi:CheY-like chemotaxis protein